MAKPRDWVDYAHVGAEFIQVSQLSSITGRLDALSRLAAAQAAGQAEQRNREERQRAIEDGIREFVFQGERFLHDLRHAQLQRNPRGTLFLIRSLAEKIDSYDLKTSRVREYSDKQAVQRLLDEVASLRKDAEKTLRPEDRKSVETCIRYKREIGEIEQALEREKERGTVAVKVQELTTALNQKQAKLASFRVQTMPRAHPLLAVMALLIGASVLTLAIAFAEKGTFVDEEALGPALFFIALGIFGLSRVPNQEVETLKREIAALVEDRDRILVPDESSDFIARFGPPSLLQYARLLEERRAYIDAVTDAAASTTDEANC